MQFWTTSLGLAKLRPMPNALADGFEKFVNDAIEVERLGFDGYGSGEHHFMYDEFIPIPLQADGGCGGEHPRRSGSATNARCCLPLYDPMEAAELAATLDVHLGRPRFSLGLGMGYRPYEFDGFGTAKRTRGARLREAMEVIRLATSQDRVLLRGQALPIHENESASPPPGSTTHRPVVLWWNFAAGRASGRPGGARLLVGQLAHSTTRENDRQGVPPGGSRRPGFDESQLRVGVLQGRLHRQHDGGSRRVCGKMLIDAFYDEHILGYGYLVDENGKNLYNPPKDHPLYQRFIQQPLLRDHRRWWWRSSSATRPSGCDMVFLPSQQRRADREGNPPRVSMSRASWPPDLAITLRSSAIVVLRTDAFASSPNDGSQILGGRRRAYRQRLRAMARRENQRRCGPSANASHEAHGGARIPRRRRIPSTGARAWPRQAPRCGLCGSRVAQESTAVRRLRSPSR